MCKNKTSKCKKYKVCEKMRTLSVKNINCVQN